MENVVTGPFRKKQLKREVQQSIQRQTDEYWTDKIRSLVMPGNFVSLLIDEDTNVTWKSYLWNLPCGIAKFAINSSLDTLPSGDNLKRWGKRVSDVCPLCGNSKQTLSFL